MSLSVNRITHFHRFRTGFKGRVGYFTQFTFAIFTSFELVPIII